MPHLSQGFSRASSRSLGLGATSETATAKVMQTAYRPSTAVAAWQSSSRSGVDLSDQGTAERDVPDWVSDFADPEAFRWLAADPLFRRYAICQIFPVGYGSRSAGAGGWDQQAGTQTQVGPRHGSVMSSGSCVTRRARRRWQGSD